MATFSIKKYLDKIPYRIPNSPLITLKQGDIIEGTLLCETHAEVGYQCYISYKNNYMINTQYADLISGTQQEKDNLYKSNHNAVAHIPGKIECIKAPCDVAPPPTKPTGDSGNGNMLPLISTGELIAAIAIIGLAIFVYKQLS